MNIRQIVTFFEKNGKPEEAIAMLRFGIRALKIYGIRIPVLRKLAAKIGKNHTLATKLWHIDSRETRILACMIAEPMKVTEHMMDAWVSEFDNWEICDQCVQNLFEKTPYAYSKAIEWSQLSTEYIKRAGFVLMARLAVSDKKAPDIFFIQFMPLIEKECDDPRQMVKKAVSWSLRQMGKRNLRLYSETMNTINRMKSIQSAHVSWIVKDVLKELTSDYVINKIHQ